MTVHINAKKEDISNIVLMPGDPMRAKMISEKFLTDAKLINTTRGMLGYTGYYKNRKVTVMASGMGNASMGIYSYELFNDYDVDYILRIGTCGAYTDKLNLYDLILVDKSYSNTSYGINLGYNDNNISSSDIINNVILNTINNKDFNVVKGNIHCTDTFYEKDYSEFLNYNCLAVEMETFALFTNAKVLNKQASCILTVSDSLVTGEKLSSEEREKSTIKMIELALESVINL
jgi:purine-nucleoside phosphorylase